MQEKKIMCPMCITRYGEYNKMQYTPEGYYKCHKCDAEVWPGDLKPDELAEFMRSMANTHYSTDALPSGEALKGGSGNSKGKKHKTKSDKPTTATIYKQLFKET